uniref:Glyco_hydro_38N domain-containing protein n=1 Tax=Heterorhabditis bacteriophora TaxID=37862 RepID=A0A1I7XN53_HETBA
MRKIQKEIAYSESKREQLNKQIEKENEVYDVKAEAEKALEKSINQIEGDANHKAVEEEQRGMLDVYDLISFDNTDGGVWKQGWELTYDANKVSNGKRLEVIVIPHSHCDPGTVFIY